MKRFLPFIIGFALFPTAAYAFDIGTVFDCTGFVGCNSSIDIVMYLVSRLVLIIDTFLFPLTVVMFLYGALRMTTSRGEEGKEAGKKALMYAAMGFAAALLTTGIFGFVCGYVYLLGGTPSACSMWGW